MFSYYLKSALKYFLHRKVYISFSITGLVIAFSVSSLIMMYVINELKFNSEHKNREFIYRVISNYKGVNTSLGLTTLDLGPLIQESFPEVEKMSRYTQTKSWVIKAQQEVITKSAFVDSSFSEMFSFHVLEGDSKRMFSESNAVIITKALSKTIFGNEPAVGKQLNVRFKNDEYLFRVNAVIEKFSEFSSVTCDMYFSFEFYHKNLCDPFLESYPFFTTFLMTSENASIKMLEEKINQANVNKWTGNSDNTYQLQCLTKMYLHSDKIGNHLFPSGNVRILYGLIILVSLVIIMACLNFGILTTACTISRNKEVGVRKINGASARHIRQQLIFESYLQTILALPAALFVAYSLLPWFNNYLGRSLTFNLAGSIHFITGITLLVILTATISGLFASVISSRMNPVQLLRKDQPKFGLGINLNKILLTGQMIVLIWFLVVTIVVFKQISFSKSNSLGYNPENLLVIHLLNPTWEPDMSNPKYENAHKLEDLRQKLLGNSSIKDVSVVHHCPPMGDQLSSGIIINSKNNETINIAGIRCFSNFPGFMGYELKSGTFFSENYSGDEQEILLNEAAVKLIGLENPVGEIVKMDGSINARIVGVVNNFNFQSTRQEIVPLRICKTNEFQYQFDILIRYVPHKAEEAINIIKQLLNSMYKGYESEITFHEEKINELYKKELLEAKMMILGIILAIFIATMGILGITLFSVKQQVKEIGIRKINGARVSNILWMLNLNLLKWVAIAFIIACPLALYAIHQWLQNFAYKTEVSWWVFASAGTFALLIALLTVNWQSYRTASKNPVESLRYE